MRVTADTNILARAIMGDDVGQSPVATAVLEAAELVAITTPALCELVWILRSGFKVPSARVAQILRQLLNASNVVVDRPVADAGMRLLEAGGDFADGAIAYQGKWLGADTFVSFDKKAVTLLSANGKSTRLL